MQCDTVLVIGANRGIGLAITRAILEMNSVRRVFASYRHKDPESDFWQINDARLIRSRVDVTNEADIVELADMIRDHGNQPDLVINAAGILHEPGVQPEKALHQCRQNDLLRLFSVNSIGPLLVAKALIPLMPRNRPSHFAVLSAMVGSIGDNRLGGWYGYRASKAALNQFMRTLAVECRRNRPHLCISAIHPGTTDTGLSRPFQANVKPGKLYTPGQSADRILRVIEAGTPENSGRFVNWDGNDLPF
jgi:NAD(P)-dependent dehydrogenase (short-subunit alcohol dehydrogenase family)